MEREGSRGGFHVVKKGKGKEINGRKVCGEKPKSLLIIRGQEDIIGDWIYKASAPPPTM